MRGDRRIPLPSCAAPHGGGISDTTTFAAEQLRTLYLVKSLSHGRCLSYFAHRSSVIQQYKSLSLRCENNLM
jgi:hypothetical protein